MRAFREGMYNVKFFSQRSDAVHLNEESILYAGDNVRHPVFHGSMVAQ
jgi:hypothetical protein